MRPSDMDEAFFDKRQVFYFDSAAGNKVNLLVKEFLQLVGQFDEPNAYMPAYAEHRRILS
jgi:hypothetical protein